MHNRTASLLTLLLLLLLLHAESCAYDEPWSHLNEKQRRAAQMLGMTSEDFVDEPALSLEPLGPESRATEVPEPINESVSSHDEFVLSITCTSSETVHDKKPFTQYVLQVEYGRHVYSVHKRWAELYELSGVLNRIKWRQAVGLRWDDQRSRTTLPSKRFSSIDQNEVAKRISEINEFLKSVSDRLGPTTGHTV